MSVVGKVLLFAAGLMLTISFIGLGIYFFRVSKDASNASGKQLTKIMSEFSEGDKSMYDGLQVSGSEVINVITKFKNEDIGIIVNTKKSANVCYIRTLTASQSDGVTSYTLGSIATTSIKNAQDIDNSLYINPQAQFNGEVLKDMNNVLVGIEFTQE